MDYGESLQYLYSFVDWERGIGYGVNAPPRFTLDRIGALLRLLNNPQERFPSIHIAGSKGKGSTAAIIESVLRAAGLRTGLYTQPHLHTFRERVRINNKPVSSQEFTRLVERIVPAVDALKSDRPDLGDPTTYELATALGFLCFAEAAVDMAVVEVGLGGRLDATNVITPHVSVITSISLEHTAILGDTLDAIAREKAGIVKDNGVLVHAPNPANVTEVFRQTCLERRARIIAAEESRCEPITPRGTPDYSARACSNIHPHNEYGAGSEPVEGSSIHGSTGSPRTDYSEDSGQSAFPTANEAKPGWEFPVQTCKIRVLEEECVVRFPLRGRHQRTNLSVALAVVDELAAQGLPLSSASVRAGIESVQWLGRFEHLSARPLVIADGAHTPDAMKHLRQTLAEHYPGRRIHCVLGTTQDKSVKQLLDVLVPAIERLIVCRSRHPRAQEPRVIAAAAAGKVPITQAESVEQAISMGLDSMCSEDVLCATGSLFVAAEAREAFGLAEFVDPPLDRRRKL
ncbi:MAG: bifunctional folylpolyglutamate synthase/dihydrofolate synthase [Chloroflexi bacterium]|nr:bifunctional folylpolyglutamate synthase/dihydrofolate synthase [Chloroflexota bacterium]